MNWTPAEIRAVILLFLAAGVSALVVTVTSATPRSSSGAMLQATPTVSPTSIAPSSVTGPLNGETTAARLAFRRPIAVIVGNLYPSARPQAGLSRASVVFETLVEGGVTRLMPIFLERDARDVGPIRSARPYFVKWAAGFGAILVHAGGSPAARRLLSIHPRWTNVDALLPHAEFTRDASRSAPDNLFGGTTGMRVIAQRAPVSSALPPNSWPHKRPLALPDRGRIDHIHVEFSTAEIASAPQYAVDYRFDRASNAYTRLEGGVPAIDRAANRSLTAQNVVVLYTSITRLPNDLFGRLAIAAVGHGRAQVFRDGLVTRGIWSKSSPAAPLRLSSFAGRPIALDPGQTWIEVTTPGDATWGVR